MNCFSVERCDANDRPPHTQIPAVTDHETGASLTSNGSPEGNACVETFARVAREMATEKQAALAELRAKGIVAVGADDGWVNREKNTWTPPSYATIFEPIKVGDHIAFATKEAAFAAYQTASLKIYGEFSCTLISNEAGSDAVSLNQSLHHTQSKEG